MQMPEIAPPKTPCNHANSLVNVINHLLRRESSRVLVLGIVEVSSSNVLVATNKDGQELGVRPGHNTSNIELVASCDIIVGEGVALVVDLVLVDDFGVPVDVVT